MKTPSSERAVNPLTRRRLLKISGLAGLALAGGSTLLMWGSSDRYRQLLPRGAKPTVLSEKELAVLTAFCDQVIFAAPGKLSAREARLAERLDREFAFHTPKMVSDLQAALLLIEHGGWAHGQATRFTRLAPAEQEAYLSRMSQASDLERQAFSGLKLMALFFFYCDERSWKHIGYDGPLVTVRAPPEADSNPFSSEKDRTSHG